MSKQKSRQQRRAQERDRAERLHSRPETSQRPLLLAAAGVVGVIAVIAALVIVKLSQGGSTAAPATPSGRASGRGGQVRHHRPGQPIQHDRLPARPGRPRAHRRHSVAPGWQAARGVRGRGVLPALRRRAVGARRSALALRHVPQPGGDAFVDHRRRPGHRDVLVPQGDLHQQVHHPGHGRGGDEPAAGQLLQAAREADGARTARFRRSTTPTTSRSCTSATT